MGVWHFMLVNNYHLNARMWLNVNLMEPVPKQRKGSTTNRRSPLTGGAAMGGVLAGILQWVRSPIRQRMVADASQRDHSSQPATAVMRRHIAVAPFDRTWFHALPRREMRSTGAGGGAPPLPLRARAGAGIARADSRTADADNRPTQEPACRAADRAFPGGNGTASACPG